MAVIIEKQGSEEASIHYEDDEATECKTEESGQQDPKSNGVQQDESPPPPDGGYGWFIVVGAFLVQVTSYGTTTSWYGLRYIIFFFNYHFVLSLLANPIYLFLQG